jgi:triosephosphate isomerase
MALSSGLIPIVCVGESLEQRQLGQTADVVKRQLLAVIQGVGHCMSEVVVAYEPVWAIGTGQTATAEQAQEVHGLLRAQLKAAVADHERIAILYGGSMNAANAKLLLSTPGIDGGLIGGASLKPVEFLSILTDAHALGAT